MAKQEKNIVRRIVIRYWYNDMFRIGVMVFPTWLIALGAILLPLGAFDSPYILPIFGLLYLAGFLAMCKWNDYSNLKKIGLDEYGNPLEGDDQ